MEEIQVKKDYKFLLKGTAISSARGEQEGEEMWLVTLTEEEALELRDGLISALVETNK